MVPFSWAGKKPPWLLGSGGAVKGWLGTLGAWLLGSGGAAKGWLGSFGARHHPRCGSFMAGASPVPTSYMYGQLYPIHCRRPSIADVGVYEACDCFISLFGSTQYEESFAPFPRVRALVAATRSLGRLAEYCDVGRKAHDTWDEASNMIE
jgi:hypothetical protein